MKKYIFLFFFLPIIIKANCQGSELYPYNGGKNKFTNDFSQFFDKSIKVNDTSSLWFIVYSFDKKKKDVKFEIYGSKKQGTQYDLLKSIHNFNTK